MMNHQTLANLRTERDSYVDQWGKLAEMISALDAVLSLAGHDDGDDASPAATFTAKAAKEHLARQPVNKAEPFKAGGRPSLRANLSKSDVAEIRKAAAAGENHATIGSRHDVSRSTVSNIVRRKGCYA